MELKTVNSTGKWSDVAASLNENFSKTNIEVEKLKNSTTRFKGYYTSYSLLVTAWPSPYVGDYAWVGSEYPGVVYKCVTVGTWTSTTDVPSEQEVTLDNYALKTNLNTASNQIANIANPDWIVQEPVTTSTVQPAHTANYAYPVAEAGTIFGLSAVLGDWIFDDGTNFVVKRSNDKIVQIDSNNISQFASWLASYDSNYNAGGFAYVDDDIPTATLNLAYMAAENGTIFGVDDVVKGQLLIGNGSIFTKESISQKVNQTDLHTSNIEKITRVPGKNLLNPNDADIVSGHYLNSSGGLVMLAGWSVTGYIKITNGQTLKASSGTGGGYVLLYNANFEKVSGGGTGTTTVTGTSESYYCRWSFNKTDLSTVQVEIGSTATTFEEYIDYKPIIDLKKETALSFEGKIAKQIGKNLFNNTASDIVTGYYLNSSGIELDNASYFISGYIPVQNGQEYTASNFELAVAYLALYDLDKNKLSTLQTTTFTPVAHGYVRISGTLSKLNSAQLEAGTVSTAYESYTEYTPLSDFSADTLASLSKRITKKIGKNLLNIDDADYVEGYYLNGSGVVTANTSFSISGYIDVTDIESIAINYALTGGYVHFYDSAKTRLSGTGSGTVFSKPSGAIYFRASVLHAVENKQIEAGTVSTYYEPYTEYTQLGDVRKQCYDELPYPVLPSTLYFVKNIESSMYFENIFKRNLGDAVALYSNKGTSYNRLIKFLFTTTATSTMTLQTIQALKKGLSASVAYIVKDAALNSGKTVNILAIGDSFTDKKTFYAKIISLLSANGLTVNQIGTCGDASTKTESLSGGTLQNVFLSTDSGVARIVTVSGMTTLPETSYPGTFYTDDNGDQWTLRGGKIDGSGAGYVVVTKFGAVETDFDDFPAAGTLTKVAGQDKEGDDTILYSAVQSGYFNPFINPTSGELDISNYLEFWSFADPDIIILQFTWNDLSTWSYDRVIQLIVDKFVTAVDHIHTNLPSAKIVLSIEPFGSVNGNLDWHGKKATVLRFVELMLSTFEDDSAYNTFTYIAPSYAFVDLVNGYATTNVIPSSAYTDITERSGGDGIHPATAGMEQIGTCIYQIISNII